MNCLGVDPGVAIVGYGLVSETDNGLRSTIYGSIKTGSKLTIGERLDRIYNTMLERINDLKPDFLAVERLFFGRNVTSAGNVYQARGVILLAAQHFGVSVVELWPTQIKLSICEKGHATKKEIQERVKNMLSLEKIPRPDDTADALACAITGITIIHEGVNYGMD